MTLLALGAVLLAALLGAAVAVLRRRLNRAERLSSTLSTRLEDLQLQFARFAPEEVVERLTQQDSRYQPERRRVTVLFADLQGFTPLCESLDPMEMVSILNGYFQRMDDAIARHHGKVTELVGDGLLALFGALEPNPWQAQDAVQAALDMRRELAVYNTQLQRSNLPQLRFGVGIHSGDVVAGVIGTSDLRKFAVIGDAINVASRVEGLTRVHGLDLLITEAVQREVAHRFKMRPMPPAAVKGKSEPVVTYFVEGPADSAAE